MIIETRFGEQVRMKIAKYFVDQNNTKVVKSLSWIILFSQHSPNRSFLKTIEQTLTDLGFTEKQMENFTIYKWINFCLNEDKECVLLPLFFQIFFSLYFARYQVWFCITIGLRRTIDIETCFFLFVEQGHWTGMLYLLHKKKIHYRNQLIERLEQLKNHHFAAVNKLVSYRRI